MARFLIALLLASIACPAWGVAFTQQTDIVIGTSATEPTPASPYPSTNVVTGFGTISKLTVEIGLTHAYPDDIDLLLVGPTGQTLVLMSDAGGGTAVTDIGLVFVQSAGSSLPDSTALSSGTFKPTNHAPAADTWPAGTPAGPYGAELSVFDGLPANGTWSLYASDDGATLVGVITYWRLIIEAPPANDAFAAARVLSGALPLADLTARTDFTTAESGEPIIDADGTRTAWWSWTPSATQDVVIAAMGESGYYASLTVFTGATLATLSQVARDRQTDGVDPARLVLRAVAGTTYRIQLNGQGVANGEANLTITLATAPTLGADIADSVNIGAIYQRLLTVTGDATTVTVTGSLPPGVTAVLSDPARRRLFGEPTAAGTYTSILTAANTQGSDTQTITIVVNQVPVITSSPVVSATVGQPFSYSITASSSPTSYGAGSLPAGLAINALTGEISGTPTSSSAGGSIVFPVTATNAHGTGTMDLNFYIGVVGAPVITSGGTIAAVKGVPFTYTITATPAATSYVAGMWFPGYGSDPTLPPGVTRAANVITGTVADAGIYRLYVQAQNGSGSGIRTVILTVAETSGGGSASGSVTGGGSVGGGDSGGCGLTGGSAALLAIAVVAFTRRRRR